MVFKPLMQTNVQIETAEVWSRLLVAGRQHFLSNTAKMTEGVDDDLAGASP
jgi:hypothetical protein